MKRYLVIANETVGGDDLVEEIRARVDGKEAAVHVLAPALDSSEAEQHGQDATVAGGGPVTASFADPKVRHKPATSGTTDTGTEGIETVGGDASPARQTQILLGHVVDRLAAVAGDVSGEAGPSDPVEAARQAVAAQRYDEIILATPPPAASKLVGQDLTHRIQRAVDVPVTTVFAPRSDPREAQ